MAVREIRLYGDPVLLTVADEVTEFGPATRSLATDLLDTVQIPGRAGVAAPQIGVPLRAFSYNVDERLGVVFNPLILDREGDQHGDEGCLSVPELWFPTRRSRYVAVIGFDADGNEVRVAGEELMARCLEHEVDHLDGIVYLRRLEPSVRREAMRAVRASEWFSRPAGSPPRPDAGAPAARLVQ
ncbi:MAG: peptide deformylase [Jiangellaceae bacterium]|nr:peptide deformylase [Jiangellaceae bacterium]